MEITGKEHIFGAWVCGNEKMDWLCFLWREGEKIKGEYRIRYHVDDKVFDSEDRKSGARIELKEGNNEDSAIRDIHVLAKRIADMMGVDYQFIPINTSDQKVIMDRLTKHPSFHMKVLEEGDPEFEKYVREKEEENGKDSN